MTAPNPLAHKRFTVWPGTVTGKPASNSAFLATLRLSSPAWLVSPKITSSISAPGTPVFQVIFE